MGFDEIDEMSRRVPPRTSSAHGVRAGQARGAGGDGGDAEAAREDRGALALRTAGLVGAGGLACAAVGAFLGGLGGYFTVNPAAAHSVASTSATSPSLASHGEPGVPLRTGDARFSRRTAASFSSSRARSRRASPRSGRSTAPLAGDGPVPTFPLGNLADDGWQRLRRRHDGGRVRRGRRVRLHHHPERPRPELHPRPTSPASWATLGSLAGCRPHRPARGAHPDASRAWSATSAGRCRTSALSVTVSSLPLPALRLPGDRLRGVGARARAANPTTPRGGQRPSPTVGALGPVLNGVAAAGGGPTGSTAPLPAPLPLPAGRVGAEPPGHDADGLAAPTPDRRPAGRVDRRRLDHRHGAAASRAGRPSRSAASPSAASGLSLTLP